MSYLPMTSLTLGIPYPPSDRSDTVDVSVSPLRRSVPVIYRFSPVLGWWTILQLLTCRATESISFSVPDRNTLWNRAEDDLLVQSVAKYSTPNVLGHDWIEVTSELSGHLPLQCQERHRLTHTESELTFVFLPVTFRDSPFIHYTPVSSLLCVYNDNRDISCKITTSPSLCYSLTHAHRSIGYRNPTQPLAESVTRLMHLRVYDNRDSSLNLLTIVYLTVIRVRDTTLHVQLCSEFTAQLHV